MIIRFGTHRSGQCPFQGHVTLLSSRLLRNSEQTKMASRSSMGGAALKRLMTEYRQLTSGGGYPCRPSTISCGDDIILFTGSPDGMFTAGRLLNTCIRCPEVTYTILCGGSKGPISESDFFTWEALICGPKDTPFVSKRFNGTPVSKTEYSKHTFLFFWRSSGGWCFCSKTHVCKWNEVIW